MTLSTEKERAEGNETMDVLMLLNRLNVGGTERYVINLALGLQKQGFQVGIAARRGPLAAETRRQGIPFHPIKGLNPSTEVSRIIKKYRYRLLHAHDTPSYRVVARWADKSTIPVVLTVHGRYHGIQELKSAARKAGKIIAVTPRLRDWVRGMNVPDRKIALIPIGIDTKRFVPQSRSFCRKHLSLPEDAEVVAYASRFSRDKIPIARMLVKSSETVARKRQQSLFVLAGPGPYLNELQNKAAAVNRGVARKAVLVRPAMKRVEQLYGAADLVVGTGTVAAEAMLCGKPVIAAGVRGYYGIIRPANVREAMRNQFGDHGGKRQGSPAVLARDIVYLLSRPHKLKEYGAMGRRIALRRFAVRKISEQIKAVYLELLSKRNSIKNT
jgi:glycosyltransferase involved in cell wall biosynthesis